MAMMAINAPAIRQGATSEPKNSASQIINATTNRPTATSVATDTTTSGTSIGRLALIARALCRVVVMRSLVALAAHRLQLRIYKFAQRIAHLSTRLWGHKHRHRSTNKRTAKQRQKAQTRIFHSNTVLRVHPISSQNPSQRACAERKKWKFITTFAL